ncbi:fumarate hydratase, partial [Chloroflexota bacterium]
TVRDCVGSNPCGRLLLCPDTGAPTFYVRVGDNVRLQEGFSSLWEIGKRALSDITKQGRLRPNLVHPITRANYGDNTGRLMPQVELVFDPTISHMDIMAVPVSGGSETSGTFFRMMSPVDGRDGILRFVLDCVLASTYAGKTCPPNIIGVGIGGPADMCMRLAKQAAVVRPIGRHNPDPDIAALENEVLGIVNSLEIGPLGRGGNTGAHAVHIEYAACHISGLPVAYNAQCLLGRRGVARIEKDGAVAIIKSMEWPLQW